MSSPLENFNEEELAHYVESLLEQAITRLETKDFRAVAWRLADALGAMTALCPDGGSGLDTYTGLGYRIDVRDFGKPNDDTK